MGDFFDCSAVKVRRGPMLTLDSPPRPKPMPQWEPVAPRDLLAEQMRAQQNMQGQSNIFGQAFGLQNMFPGQTIPVQRSGNSMFGNAFGGIFGG